MGLKDLLMRKMLQSKMKDVPVDQQEKILAMVEKNPEFFQKIAIEVQEKMKQGKDQMAATMEVMQKYQNDLKGML
jgi:hypothetical protein